MLDKLQAIKERREEVGKLITDPEVIADMKRYVRLSKEYKDLGPIVEMHKQYKNVLDNIKSSKEILATEKDEEFREMAKGELDELVGKKEKLDEEIKIMLIPKDPEDEKNAVMEIRAGTGGNEAGIFAGDLYRMYTKFCESKRWKTELVDYTEAPQGGFKEVIFNVEGEEVYGLLKYESGVHRVQRVPKTETQGRVHTSAASVVVLPEADEFDVQLKDEDIRRDEFCSSGPGGQSVNTTYSAIRLTHIPTGIVVSCQDQKSKLKNLEKATSVLRARIYELELRKRHEIEAAKRKTMVSTGDRSAKIRTYNWQQGRVTDHRIGLTLYNLEGIINGDIEEFMESLRVAENAEKLKSGMEEVRE
ncbi:MAG: peptide chain release factor 1 [Flavobacteriales bacterium]|nr:MAG: peptide chain release factor 1 [Flavobacteriales bacterium]